MKKIKLQNPIIKTYDLIKLIDEGIILAKEYAKILELPESLINSITNDGIYITKTWEIETLACITSDDELPLVLVGGTGLGKTALINDIAKKLKYNIITFHLAQYNDISDFLGIVIPKPDGTTNFEWNESWRLIFELNKEYEEKSKENPNYLPPPNKRVIIFLDEYNRAMPSMLASIFSLLSDYRIKGIQLYPQVVRLIGSINPVGDYNVKLEDIAFKSRVSYLPVEADLFRWKHWLEKEASEEIPKAPAFIQDFADVIGTLEREKFSRTASFEEYEGEPSPRAWTRFMTAYFKRKGLSKQLAIGTIGKEATERLNILLQEKLKNKKNYKEIKNKNEMIDLLKSFEKEE